MVRMDQAHVLNHRDSFKDMCLSVPVKAATIEHTGGH